MKRYLITIYDERGNILTEDVQVAENGREALIKYLTSFYALQFYNNDRILLQEENEDNKELFEGR